MTAPFTLARRAAHMNPSVIREILKVTERPGIISLAGGLPSPDTFPGDAMREASAKVLRDTPVVRGELARMRSTLLMVSGVLLGVCLLMLGLMGLQLVWVLRPVQ